MKVRYQFRFYPTPRQERSLAKTFGCCRFVYNWGLKLRTNSYRKDKTNIGYHQSSAMLTKLKAEKEFVWLNEVSSTNLQQALRHLQTSFKNFFQKTSKYPVFKSRKSKQSAEFTKHAFRFKNHNLYLCNLGHINVHWSRKFQSSPTTVTITKDRSGRYFVTLCLDEKIEKLPTAGRTVGIDLGVNRLMTLSNGERITNPRFLRKYEKKLASAQKQFSRKKKGSGRWKSHKLKIAKIHGKLTDCRLDYINKLTTDLVQRFDHISVEDLNVRGMVKNRRLAKSISDSVFGTIVRQLEYKCNWYGKTLVKIDRFFPSSKRCSDCGHINQALKFEREWTCVCGSKHDRDDNAAKNILMAGGHPASARGGNVRLALATAKESDCLRSVNLPALDAVSTVSISGSLIVR